MKIDSSNYNDSEQLIKHQFQQYMNDMEKKMMELSGVNKKLVDENSNISNRASSVLFGENARYERKVSEIESECKKQSLKIFEESIRKFKEENKNQSKIYREQFSDMAWADKFVVLWKKMLLKVFRINLF